MVRTTKPRTIMNWLFKCLEFPDFLERNFSRYFFSCILIEPTTVHHLVAFAFWILLCDFFSVVFFCPVVHFSLQLFFLQYKDLNVFPRPLSTAHSNGGYCTVLVLPLAIETGGLGEEKADLPCFLSTRDRKWSQEWYSSSHIALFPFYCPSPSFLLRVLF